MCSLMERDGQSEWTYQQAGKGLLLPVNAIKIPIGWSSLFPIKEFMWETFWITSVHVNQAPGWDVQVSKHYSTKWDTVMFQTHSSFQPWQSLPGTSHLLLSSTVSFPRFQHGHLSSSTYTLFLFLALETQDACSNIQDSSGQEGLEVWVRSAVYCHINNLIRPA